MSIQANHLAPFLLTNLLADRVGRVVVTASGAHRFGALDPDDLNAPLRGYRPMGAYGTSKQANILFTAEAARRWPDIPAYSFHPGVVRTRFANDSRLGRVRHAVHAVPQPGEGCRDPGVAGQPGSLPADRRGLLRRPSAASAVPEGGRSAARRPALGGQRQGRRLDG